MRGCSLLMLILNSCGVAPTNDAETLLTPYVKAFEAQALSEGVDVRSKTKLTKLAFIDTRPNDTLLARCYMHLNYIEVYRPKWKEFDTTKRELIMFHELGHCILNRIHEVREDTETLADSIMVPNVFSDDEYLQHRRYYLNELFHPEARMSLEMTHDKEVNTVTKGYNFDVLDDYCWQ